MEEEVLERLSEVESLQFRWIHDRMQQAAYEISPDTEKPLLHITIGSVLLDQLKKRSPSYSPDMDISSIDVNERKTVLEIADHFERASKQIKTVEEIPRDRRDSFAMVAFQAGSLALKAASADSAQRLFITAIAYLGKDAWTRQSGATYGVCFESHLRGFMAATMNNDDEKGMALFADARSNAKDKKDVARLMIQEALRRAYRSPSTSFQPVKEALKAVGLGFIAKASKLSVLRYLMKTYKWTKKYTTSEIEAFPAMTDPEHVFICDLLANTE
ncbi:hypothetical protein HDU67_003792, partial [Dinochytrium kinnereticum]